VKPMEEEKEGSEQKDHIPPEDESSSTEEWLPEDEEKEKESKHVIKNIPWTTAKNFTVEIGQQQIEELISTAPVEVFYRLESSRLIRRPEQCEFREKWLHDIIENKVVCAERLASR
ncbi:hypothetical protein EK904_008927, partial [Melospiza melodia maxima]